MGYTHGTQWSNERIETAIKDVMTKAKIDTFPTHSQVYEITGNYALSNAIRRNGGTRYWAEKLGLDIKKSESKFGEEYEILTMLMLNNLGFLCKKMPVKYPYDILVENGIKVDVKCSNINHGKTGDFYTFNLEKPNPTCDIFVCLCLENTDIKRVYVIPSVVLYGKTQLHIGKNAIDYEKYMDDWRIFNSYRNFNRQLSE